MPSVVTITVYVHWVRLNLVNTGFSADSWSLRRATVNMQIVQIFRATLFVQSQININKNFGSLFNVLELSW